MEPKKPFHITEQPGIKYYCACGRSAGLPYCDGAHKGSDFHPYRVEILEDTHVSICSCGKSAKLPFCDGAHKALL